MTSKSSPALPFASLGDPFELMQKIWGMGGAAPANLAAMAGRLPQQMPSMIAPTVDVQELDKCIAAQIRVCSERGGTIGQGYRSRARP